MGAEKPESQRATSSHKRAKSGAGKKGNASLYASIVLSDAIAELGKSLTDVAQNSTKMTDEAVAGGLRAAARSLESVSTQLAKRPRGKAIHDEILNAAAQAFATRGFDGASVDEIAVAAGYTKGAVYSRYTSKSALFLAVIDSRLCVNATDAKIPVDRSRNVNALLAIEAITFGLRHDEHRDKVIEILNTAMENITHQVTDTASPDNDHDAPADETSIAVISLSIILPALQELGLAGTADLTVLEVLANLDPPAPA